MVTALRRAAMVRGVDERRRAEREAYRAAFNCVPGARRKWRTGAILMLISVVVHIVGFIGGLYLLMAIGGLLNMVAVGLSWHVNDQVQLHVHYSNRSGRSTG